MSTNPTLPQNHLRFTTERLFCSQNVSGRSSMQKTLKGKKLAPILLMASVIWLAPAPVYALINDSQITIKSSADVSSKRQALIRFIWGSAGFPSNKLPSSVLINIPALSATSAT